MDHHGSAGGLSDADMAVLRRAAHALARQHGAGVPRAALVDLAGTTSRPLTIWAPEPGSDDPVLAVVAAPRPGAAAEFGRLTDRELQIAELVAAGHSNQHIARTLTIALGTVKDHVHHILTKTGLPSRAAIAATWHA